MGTSAPLVTVRGALVLLIAIVVGMIAGVLAYHVDRSAAKATLTGGAAAAAAVVLFNTMLAG